MFNLYCFSSEVVVLQLKHTYRQFEIETIATGRFTVSFQISQNNLVAFK